MAVIAIQIEPRGRTRVMFDCRKSAPRPEDEERIMLAVTQAHAQLSQALTPVAAQIQAGD